MIITNRRSFLTGLSALFVAPAIIRAENLMRVHEMELPIPDWCPAGWLPMDGREIKKKFYPDLYRSYEQMRFPLSIGRDDPSPGLSRNQLHYGYDGYVAINNKLEPSYVRIISAKDQYRSNGTIAKAGLIATIQIPGTV